MRTTTGFTVRIEDRPAAPSPREAGQAPRRRSNFPSAGRNCRRRHHFGEFRGEHHLLEQGGRTNVWPHRSGSAGKAPCAHHTRKIGLVLSARHRTVSEGRTV